MDTLSQFKSRVLAFIDETGLKPSRFGVQACGDPNFVADLRAGREPRESTRSKVEKFMDAYKIPGAASAAPVANPTRDPVGEGARRV